MCTVTWGRGNGHGQTITWGVEDKKKTNSARGFCIY